MTPWAIYYADGSVVRGKNRVRWQSAPDDGVQVVVAFTGENHGRTYPVDPSDPHGPQNRVTDRRLWTGTDEYDPFGWGAKRGSLIPDLEYWTLWSRACGEGVH